MCLKGPSMAAAVAAAVVVEARPELVGKRFLCVSGEAPPELAEISRWPWRVGVIRALSHRDTDNPELTVRAAVPSLQRTLRHTARLDISPLCPTFLVRLTRDLGLVHFLVFMSLVQTRFHSHFVEKLSFFIPKTNPINSSPTDG